MCPAKTFRSDRRWLWVKRATMCALSCALLSCLETPLRAQDVVVLRGGGATDRIEKKGTIQDYTGEVLLLKTKSARVSRIDPERIIAVRTQKTSNHQQGDRLFEQGKYELALRSYAQAMQRDEKRTWVLRQMAARRIWCYRSLGQIVNAVSMFRSLVGSDGSTPYFNAIPLTWFGGIVDARVEREAENWRSASQAEMKLIGASWSLAGRQRSSATQTLQKLAADIDPRIATLATAQLWRLEIAAANVSQTDAWAEQIRRIPRSLRAGPYLVLGMALAQQEKHQEAALAALRVPILYPDARDLSGRALLFAGRTLARANRNRQARGLYREVMAKHEGTRLAVEAQQLLNQLSPAGKK